MKFTCLQENLIKGLNAVSKVSGKNISLPILNNILISAQSDGVDLMSTNLEIGIKAKVRGKTEREGKITVPARVLTGFINYLPQEKVDFEVINGEIMITCGTWQTKIKTQPAEDYPLIPEVDKKNEIKIKVGQLANVLNQTVFAAVTNESRPELSGGYFKININELLVVATDSYRLAEKKVELEKGSKKEESFIVPIKSLQELIRILSELAKDDEIQIFWEENQIMFLMPGIEFTSRLIDGEYPDYQQIIPTTSKSQIIFSKNEVMNAIKASSLFAKTGVYDINFEFKKPNQIIIRSANAQVGENEAKIKAEVKGEDNNIVFNYHYVLEGLQNIPQDKVVLEMTTPANPAVLKPQGKNSYLYLIMPIRQ